MAENDIMTSQDRSKAKKELILALIPSTAYTSLQPSSKNQLLGIVDMFMDYIYAAPVETPAKVKTKKSKKEITEKSPSIKQFDTLRPWIQFG